jgi:hypothetical protein
MPASYSGSVAVRGRKSTRPVSNSVIGETYACMQSKCSTPAVFLTGDADEGEVTALRAVGLLGNPINL